MCPPLKYELTIWQLINNFYMQYNGLLLIFKIKLVGTTLFIFRMTSLFSKLQAVLLQQQSFLQKCEAWMDFLSQTEQKLAAEISGNYQSLLEQQREHEVRDILKRTNCRLCIFSAVNTYMCTYSCSRQRCLAGNRFSTPSSMMAIICWTRDKWTTGKHTQRHTHNPTILPIS